MSDTAQRYEEHRSDSPEALERLLTVRQAAEALAVSRATVYRLLDDGALPAVRVRSDMRIAASDVRDFIARAREVRT